MWARTAMATAAVLLLGGAASSARAQSCDTSKVLIALDRSASMLDHGKWDDAFDAVSQVTDRFEAQVDMGFMMFPMPSQCGPGEVAVEIARNTHDEIVDAMNDNLPRGGNWTPLAETLDAVTDYRPMQDDTKDRHLIFITDGWQCCDVVDNTCRENDQTLAFGPTEDLARMGVHVHIVGFGTGVYSWALNRMAVLAQTAKPGCDSSLEYPESGSNHCYHQADDIGDLIDALEDVLSVVASEEERCDRRDNDCDGEIDEDFDRDGDGHASCDGVVPIFFPLPGDDDSTDGTPPPDDCDDNDPNVNPDAEDMCDDADNDCDGVADVACFCEEGETRDCGLDEGICRQGLQTCRDGRWSGCEDETEPRPGESCDGEDEDCDGTVDEDAECGRGFACDRNRGECIDLEEDPPPLPGGGGSGEGDSPTDEDNDRGQGSEDPRNDDDEFNDGENEDDNDTRRRRSDGGVNATSDAPEQGGCGCVVPGAEKERGYPLPGLLGAGLVIGLLSLRRHRRSTHR